MISFIFIIIASIANSIMDKIRFHWNKSIFSNIENPKILKWVKPSLSWVNKWENKEAKKEKFIGSSTIFVFVTDLWHLAQFIMLSCLFFAVVFYEPVFGLFIDFFICHFLFGGFFSLFFDWIWVKK